MTWPSDDDLLAAWQALAADPNTFGAFCDLALPPLIAAMEAIPGTDPADAVTAAEDALFALAKNPVSYDPTRGTVRAYLGMSARGDLKNLQDKERRQRAKQISIDAVELDPPARNEEADDDSPFDLAAFAAAVSELSDIDRRAVELMADGVRDTARFAPVFGVEHLPPAEQAAAVKRHKDRIKARLGRGVERPDA